MNRALSKYVCVVGGLLASLYGAIAGADVPLPAFFAGTWFEQPLYALHIGNPVVANLSGSLFVSIVFWLLIVDWPEMKNRSAIRDSLNTAFKNFRNEIRWALLGASGPCTLETTEDTRDPEVFRSYFEETVQGSQSRWDVTLDELQKGGLYLRKIYAAFDAISDEISYALHRTVPRSREAHDRMREFLTFVYQFKAAYVPGQPLEFDDTKWLGRELWALMVTADKPDGVDPYELVVWIRNI